MIIPGILEKTFEEIKSNISLVEGVADLIHIDFADGKLVNGETSLEVERLNEIETSASLELHLMVQNPTDFLFPIKNVVRVIAHVEANNILGFIEKAKELNYAVGLCINPETSPDAVDEFLGDTDFVQFMTVIPGEQGRNFETTVLEKIAKFRQNHSDIKVQVDGGISAENIQKVIDTGVNDIVVGSAIFRTEDPVVSFEELKKWSKQ